MRFMRFRRIILFLALMGIGGALAQGEGQPVVASRLLEVYLAEKSMERSRKGPAIALTVLGGGLMSGGLALLILPDYLKLGGPGKYLTWGAVAGTGAAMTAAGLAGLVGTPADLHVRYRYILLETDDQRREVLAAAELQELAARAKSRRVARGVAYLALEALVLGISLISSTREGISIPYLLGFSWGPLMGAAIQFRTRSMEERLYNQYLDLGGGSRG